MDELQWQHAHDGIKLAANQVHVWVVSLNRAEAERRNLYQHLSADERDRAGRFHFDRDRFHYIVGRGILRQLIGRYLGINPAQIEFEYGEYGKPMIHTTQQMPDGWLEFNLSHSHGMALYAFVIDREVGVDIEQIRPLSDAHSIAERYFSASEYEKFTAVPPTLQPQAFFNCWTRKEAYIKAIGDGLTCPLDAFDVTLTPGRPAQLLRIRGSIA
ncbi:MAG: 4'-phosphopantetheinyl transferase, partial [Chloroflexi bacterium]